MSLPVEFLSGADAELQGTFNRFEDYRDGSGLEFMAAVDAYLARISVFPGNCPHLLQESPTPGDAGLYLRNFL